MIRMTLVCLLFVFCPLDAFSGNPPANSDLALEDSFDRDELGEGWKVNNGDWQIVNGSLRGSEIAAQNHAAALRHVLPTSNAVYQMRFRLSEKTRAFHFGFDPARGELDKKGHLFSVIIEPGKWKVLKHLDKNRRNEDPNEVLAQADTEFIRGQWYTLRVTTWANYVTARVEGKQPLKASHPTFGVSKPTLVFRCLGEGLQIDDLHVWTQR